MASVSVTEGNADAVHSTRRSLVLLQVAVAYFVLLKILYAVLVPPNGDEAYYWLWGGHLQLSYYDHAPMVGWTSAIGRLLLGWTPAGLHLPAFVTFLVLACTLRRAARWIAPHDPVGYFWLGLAVLCASPLFNALTTLNYPDHLLVCFTAPALLLIGRYLGGVLEGTERHADLYLGALFLGLAGLSKYNAVFVPAGLLVVLIAIPRLRRLFRSPHLYAAGALTFILVLPVLIWNAEHRYVSVELHAVERLNGKAAGFTPLLLLRTILLSILMLSPFLVVGFCRFIFGVQAKSRQAGVMLIGRGTAIISTLALLPLSAWGAFGTQVSPHWLVLSFLPFMLIAPLYLRSRWLIGLHLGWGVLINTVATLYYVLSPWPTDLLGIRDYEAASTMSFEQFAPAVARHAAERDAVAIVGTAYPQLARLAFALGSDANITDMGGRIDRLTGRTFGPDAAGRDMVLIGGVGRVEERFERVEQIDLVEPMRLGRSLGRYEIWLGTGFKP